MEVLAVDDDIVSREVLKGIISKAGHHVMLAESGTEALRILSGGYVKMAVVDWMLPDISGIDVCRRIRRMDFKVPPYIIIATASKIEKVDIIEALRGGANDYVEKPFYTEEMMELLKAAERFVSLQLDLQDRVVELERALEEISILRGILPICMQCGKIRTDRVSWEKIEEYLSKHANVKFSHGLCPECLESKYDDILKGAPPQKA